MRPPEESAMKSRRVMRVRWVELFLLILITAALKSEAASRPASTTKSRVAETYGKLPLTFEPNQGQSDARVKFLSRGRKRNQTGPGKHIADERRYGRCGGKVCVCDGGLRDRLAAGAGRRLEAIVLIFTANSPRARASAESCCVHGHIRAP